MTREPTPWRTLLVLAARLGVAPTAFWRLSLREWRALIAPSSNEILSRSALDALVVQYPDEKA